MAVENSWTFKFQNYPWGRSCRLDSAQITIYNWSLCNVILSDVIIIKSLVLYHSSQFRNFIIIIMTFVKRSNYSTETAIESIVVLPQLAASPFQIYTVNSEITKHRRVARKLRTALKFAQSSTVQLGRVLRNAMDYQRGCSIIRIVIKCQKKNYQKTKANKSKKKRQQTSLQLSF